MTTCPPTQSRHAGKFPAAIRGLLLPILLIAGWAQANPTQPTLGAIRWDAWHTPGTNKEHGGVGGPVMAMMESLGPKAYHYRLPFFGKVTGENSVRLGGYTPEIMGREIAFAKAGGLDYWVFLLYEEGSSMSEGLETYLKHPDKKSMPFCAMASWGTFRGAHEFTNRMKRLARLAADPAYFRLEDGRPLLYVFDLNRSHLDGWGGAAKSRALFDLLKTELRRAAGAEPYLVIACFSPDEGAELARILGAQAVTSYATSSTGEEPKPYADLALTAEKFWAKCLETEADMVPICMAGWDRRPRIEHPVPWEKHQKPGEGMGRYFLMPTPDELAAHLKRGLDFTAEYRARCPAQTVLTYAWNEHDEGGFLCPTLGEDGKPNTSRLDALSRMRKTWTPTAEKPVAPVVAVTTLPKEGLIAWYDPANPDGVEGVGSLLVLKDLSGHGHDARSSGQVRRIAFSGNLASLRLDDGYLDAPSFVSEGDVTAFVVSQKTQPGGGSLARLLSSMGGEVDWRAPSWCISLGRDTAPFGPRLNLARPQGARTRGLRLGREMVTGNSAFKGDLAEILIYNRALSAGELRFVKNYLETKWKVGDPSVGEWK